MTASPRGSPFEFRLLRQFVVLAEELNFGRAAARLHMSQPPLSVAMQNLEAAVGTRLLDRSKHHVRLTRAGEVFHRDAQRVLRQLQHAMERARRTGEGVEGSLRLSFVPSAALDVLPAIFKRFQQDYPTVLLRLTAETTTRQLQDLRDDETDLALVVGPVVDSSGLRLVDLQAQHLVVALPAAHPLAARRAVRMRDLAAEPFVSFPGAEGAGFAAALHGACQAAGFQPRVVQEASQMQAILTLVAGGLGVALVPQAMRALRMDNVVFKPIADAAPAPTYGLLFAFSGSNDNPAIQAFIRVAERALGPPPADRGARRTAPRPAHGRS